MIKLQTQYCSTFLVNVYRKYHEDSMPLPDEVTSPFLNELISETFPKTYSSNHHLKAVRFCHSPKFPGCSREWLFPNSILYQYRYYRSMFLQSLHQFAALAYQNR